MLTGKSPIRQEQGVQRRKRRQVGGVAPDTETGGLAPDTETGQTEIPRILTLRPFAFDTRLGGVILEGLFLSPHAFYRELTSPELLTVLYEEAAEYLHTLAVSSANVINVHSRSR